ncbi:unnamed protein product [Rotaria sp. Silwood1]|nr:unnamed protein product [Rotaria sp. Silwood1]CAF3761694.1 unnamed protein product [Rotaria sp. Silwood1]CAF3776519.1 unnamed protein product [Rotaria sp. Silwood1]CAF3834055.1 unnamed protein product [Rotaria sp. Silwood1]CAF4702358.1 unnamed protein product [Rotaria sp. Silwood1]
MFSRKNKATTDQYKENFLVDLKNQNDDLQTFPHPFIAVDYSDDNPPKTLVELEMMQLSGCIRAKPKWYEKMKDENIRNKWKQEALEQGSLTEKQINYVLDELQYYDSIRDDSMEMSAVDGVWQSDQLIPRDLKESFIKCVKKLEDIPESEFDWHPGTNKQILDLVHPSLFCFVNRISTIINEKDRVINVDNALEHIGGGEVININAKESSSEAKRLRFDDNYSRSDTYQWLPAEFNVSKDGQVKIESYINNLHPIEHKELYRLIGSICERFIPLFNKVLSDLIKNQNKPNRIIPDPYSWYDDADGGGEYDFYSRTLIIPDVGEFKMPSSADPNIDLRGRRLQMIVKLANIILTPENPKYPGGVWHVEGMENEHIVCTGIYYYHSSNLTQSNLQFRTAVGEPGYEQSDDRGVGAVYGLANDGPLNQEIGDIITQEDRCIAFPNIYQHRVAPFQLKHPTQPGYRKILVFFLVDPTIRILSTANIPPQQSHWLIDFIRSKPPFDKLPSIVVDKIMSYVDFPMSMKEAKQHREKLMEERKYFISQNNERLFERPFSLCEH